MPGDVSTIEDMTLRCPRCQKTPTLNVGMDVFALRCATLYCPMGNDRSWLPTLMDAIEAWNSKIYQYWIRPAVKKAMIDAGFYRRKQ